VQVRPAETARIARLETELALERDRIRRLEGHLWSLAESDLLTGLLNRSSLLVHLEQHLARCSRYRPEGAVLLVGVDGLHDIVSAAGHSDADEALAALAERINLRLRTTDAVGRWGPAELAILLPGVAAVEVAVVADTLLRLVSSTGTPKVPPGSLVASIGVAPVLAAPVEALELVELARHVMDVARSQGGGCWLAADWAPPQEEPARALSYGWEGNGAPSSSEGRTERADGRRAASAIVPRGRLTLVAVGRDVPMVPGTGPPRA